MWDEHKRSRFQQLSQQEHGCGGLTEAEQVELACLTQEIEAMEASYLAPAKERIRRERESLEAQNHTLQVLTWRKEALLLRLRDFLAEAQAERRAIETELATVLAGGQGAETDE
jgi:hypothetical protein